MAELRTADRAGASLAGLIDALDAVLADGAAVTGDIIIALDGIDLVRLDLRLLLAGIQGVPAVDGVR